jgi:hypothetical protein
MARKRSEPNLFELRGGGASITWTPAGLAGRAQLTYDDGEQQASFGPDQIRLSRSPLGRLVSADLRVIPDLGTTTLVLVVPPVNLGDKREQHIRTLAVITVERTSIGGPGLVAGQLQTYKALRLSGYARQVEF